MDDCKTAADERAQGQNRTATVNRYSQAIQPARRLHKSRHGEPKQAVNRVKPLDVDNQTWEAKTRGLAEELERT